MTKGIDELLASARADLERLPPAAAAEAMAAGATLVDLRSLDQRQRDGDVPGSQVIGRSVLEWRLCPSSDHRLPGAPGRDAMVIVLCSQGYSSSLAAASLRALGFGRATDVEGGFEGWRDAGLPVEPCRGPTAEEAGAPPPGGAHT
jgi:rhodanese-related sulfurtransferase